jgi:hypothetical protein
VVAGIAAGAPRIALAQTGSSDPGTRLNQQADPEEAAEEAADSQREEASGVTTHLRIVAFLLMVAAATGVAIYARRLDKPVPVPTSRSTRRWRPRPRRRRRAASPEVPAGSHDRADRASNV